MILYRWEKMLRKRKGKISVVLVPDDGDSKVVRFTISRTFWRVLKVLPIFVLLFLVYGGISYFRMAQLALSTERLSEKEAKLEAERVKIVRLASILEQVKASDRQIRTMLGSKVDMGQSPKFEKEPPSQAEPAVPTVASSGAIHSEGLTGAIAKQRERARFIPSIWPVDGWVTADFSKGTGVLKKAHQGIDISATLGSIVRAAADGIVVSAGWADDLGNFIMIDHDGQFTTRYSHSSKVLVRQGDVVKKGQTIALVGSSGHSTGPHLHYEVWQGKTLIDPRKFLIRDWRFASRGVL